MDMMVLADGDVTLEIGCACGELRIYPGLCLLCNEPVLRIVQIRNVKMIEQGTLDSRGVFEGATTIKGR